MSLQMVRFHWFLWLSNILEVCDHTFFKHSSVGGHLGCFHNLAVVNNASINIRCMYPYELIFLYSLGKYLVVQLLGHRVVIFLTFWGNSIFFSRMAVPVWIPTNSERGFPFLRILANICSCLHFDWCEVVSHCGFDLYIPDDEWCWAFFHVSVSHLDVFFGKISIHVFCLFLHWIICFVLFLTGLVDFGKFFIDSGY